jgi:hypothetical protein
LCSIFFLLIPDSNSRPLPESNLESSLGRADNGKLTGTLQVGNVGAGDSQAKATMQIGAGVGIGIGVERFKPCLDRISKTPFYAGYSDLTRYL